MAALKRIQKVRGETFSHEKTQRINAAPRFRARCTEMARPSSLLPGAFQREMRCRVAERLPPARPPAQELGQIAKSAPSGITAGPINGDNMLAWEAAIKGDVSRCPFCSALALSSGARPPDTARYGPARPPTAGRSTVALTPLPHVRRPAPRGRAAPSS